MESKIIIQQYQSPCGDLVLGSYKDMLCLCDWNLKAARRALIDRRLAKITGAVCSFGDSNVLRNAAEQLDEYFSGHRAAFTIPLFISGTDFQCSVWNGLRSIQYGHTVSYRGLSSLIGHPMAVRAVANAVAANALSVFVPCHRVIGCNNTLTGYAGGLEAKRYLLSLEKRFYLRPNV